MAFDPQKLAALLRSKAQTDRLWRPETKAAGCRLFQQGDEATHGWILETGLVKLSYVTADGNDWIKSFIADHGIFAGNNYVTLNASNRFSAICLEPSVVVALPITWLAHCIDSNRNIQSAFVSFSLWLQQRKQEREETLLCLNAEHRYQSFLRDQGPLATRLRQKDIARYIGITAIALSRIRKRQTESSKLGG